MENRNIERRDAKRRRVNSSPPVQNQSLPCKMIIIFDDTWLEALKHLTCPQWSKMSLICQQVNGIVQQNISRLPRQVIESITLNSHYLSFHPRFSSSAHILQKLFHPASYVKNVTMRTVDQKLIDTSFNGEERYIRCQTFELLPRSNLSTAPQKIEKSLKWLAQNVRSDSITLPEWIFSRIHNNVKIRALLTNFIFDTSQKCKAQELLFSLTYAHHYFNVEIVRVSSLLAVREHPARNARKGLPLITGVFVSLFFVEIVDVLLQEFLALPLVQGTMSKIVIPRYPDEEEYCANFGENLIDKELGSQNASALYVIKSGVKRIRISLCLDTPGSAYGKLYVKFYTT